MPAAAEPIRIATFNTELARDGPGLFLRDILADEAPDILAAADLIAASGADIILLQGIDYDHDQHGLAAFRDTVGRLGADYPHVFSAMPNAGVRSGQDLDGDGYSDDARDAHGFGWFAGQGGMAVLSRWPVTMRHDFTHLLWADLPNNSLLKTDPAHKERRLSSVVHWVLEVSPAPGPTLTLLAWHGTPPVFDGPEDLNGRRNEDETRLWRAYLDGALGGSPPKAHFVLAGTANADPLDGEGLKTGITQLLTDARLQDPRPKSARGSRAAAEQGKANRFHRGDPAHDTADWPDRDAGPGNLRVDYILPSADWTIIDAGILWPETPGQEASRHGLVWVDLTPR